MQMSFQSNKWRLHCFLAAMLVFVWTGCERSGSDRESGPQTFQEMMALFRDPPTSYRTAPLWVWNDEMTEEQILDQLTDFKEKGLGGVFVHPRPGLITPYLSPRWHFSYFR